MNGSRAGQTAGLRALPWDALGTDVAIAFFAWLGMDGLLFLRLSVRAFAGTYLIWATGLTLVWLAAAKWPRRRPRVEFVGAFLIGGVLALVGARLKHPIPAERVAYGVVLIAFLRLIWRTWRLPVAVGRKSETGRRLAVIAGAVLTLYPFFSDNFTGGIDARWYLYMLSDFVAQMRAGVFPVFVGQGELAFNGGVHPFRSAPVFMWLGGILDCLTLHTLTPVALQHLIAIIGAVVAGTGMYATLASLAPGRRWLAVVAALLYLGCPGVLATLYMADMYMTWMAIAALPFVVWGNARVAQTRDDCGWTPLSVALVVIWMCHPPIAMLASLTTVFIQGGRWLADGVSIYQLRNVARGAAWFGGLGLYYFYGMSELPPHPGSPLAPDLITLAACSGGLIGVVRPLLFRARSWWWGAALFATVVLWKIALAWFWWFVVFTLLTVVAAIWLRRCGDASLARWRPWVIVSAAFMATSGAWYIMGPNNPARDPGALTGLANYAPWENFFRPVSPGVDTKWDFQPGFGGWLLIGAGLLGALVIDSSTALFFSAAVLLWLLLLIRMPGVSDFLVGYFPRGIAGIINLPLALRLMPVIAAFGSGAGFLAIATLTKRRGAIVAGTLLVLALVWTGREEWKFIQRAWRMSLSRSLTAAGMKTENSVMDKFAYDLLPIPDYFSHGKMDPRLEIRILNTGLTLRFGPDELARKMEETSARALTLRVRSGENGTVWLRMAPQLELGPHEHVLLRFEFRQDRNYDGYFMLVTDWGDYREYIMPDSGMPLAFGAKPGESKVLSLWNSSDRPLQYRFTGQKGPFYNFREDDEYAWITISPYDSHQAPIEVNSFIPLRVTARMDQDGYIETPRNYLPGYEATVDGRPAPILASPQRLVMIPVAAGEHAIELRFVGSRLLRTTACISAVVWLALLALAIWRRRGPAAASQPNF